MVLFFLCANTDYSSTLIVQGVLGMDVDFVGPWKLVKGAGLHEDARGRALAAAPSPGVVRSGARRADWLLQRSGAGLL